MKAKMTPVNRSLLPRTIEAKTPAERRFKELACDFVHWGAHPTPTVMNRRLVAEGVRRTGQTNVLNGKESKWLREVVGRTRTASGYLPECEAMCCVDGGYVPVLAVPGKEPIIARKRSGMSSAPGQWAVTVTYADPPSQESIDLEAAMWADKGPGLSFPGEERKRPAPSIDLEAALSAHIAPVVVGCMCQDPDCACGEPPHPDVLGDSDVVEPAFVPIGRDALPERRGLRERLLGLFR